MLAFWGLRLPTTYLRPVVQTNNSCLLQLETEPPPHLSEMLLSRFTRRTPWKASLPHRTKAFSAMLRSRASSACSASSFHSLQWGADTKIYTSR